jgi:hypothetical protein
MTWKKLGVIVPPQSDIYWLASHVGPSFVTQSEGTLQIYITGRDLNNVSRIGIADLQLSGETAKITYIAADPIYDVGELGTFDESGVSYPWLVYHENKIYMYYVGWVNGGLNRFQNFTGLAISEDGGKTFHRVSQVPILDRSKAEPFGSGSCCVFIEDEIWKMYYTAFDKWEHAAGKNKPWYNLKFAWSKDGIEWHRDKSVVINYEGDDEHIIGKPMLIQEKGIYKLWYSHRGASYRIGYAESKDGNIYQRKDNEVGIDVSAEGWDSEMIEYNYVFDHGGRRYMVYNGNNFGKTGLGLAIWEGK